jgi:quinoprotein glucose dehydrogenase
MDLVTGEVGLHAAPVVARDTIIIGAAHLVSFSPKSKTNVKGYVRAYDVRTGRRSWIFHTIPRPGEFGADTWDDPASLRFTGNTGVWAQISVDEELGLVYLPVELPTGDFYGGHRPGNGLFGESLVAVDLKTGKSGTASWCIGIWDWDIPAPPSCSTDERQGRQSGAQPTANRGSSSSTVTAAWPIEDALPQSDVPLEDQPDAAIPDEACVRPAGRVDRRSDRLRRSSGPRPPSCQVSSGRCIRQLSSARRTGRWGRS